MRPKYWLSAVAALAFVAAAGIPVYADDNDDDDVKVKWADVPVAVQKTFEKEAPGVKIAEVEIQTDDGKTTYEAEATIDGKEYEIEVAEDGKLLEKELDDDDDDDD